MSLNNVILHARRTQVSDGDPRVTESQVAHVENEIEVRAANIVRSYCVLDVQLSVIWLQRCGRPKLFSGWCQN